LVGHWIELNTGWYVSGAAYIAMLRAPQSVFRQIVSQYHSLVAAAVDSSSVAVTRVVAGESGLFVQTEIVPRDVSSGEALLLLLRAGVEQNPGPVGDGTEKSPSDAAKCDNKCQSPAVAGLTIPAAALPAAAIAVGAVAGQGAVAVPDDEKRIRQEAAELAAVVGAKKDSRWSGFMDKCLKNGVRKSLIMEVHTMKHFRNHCPVCVWYQQQKSFAGRHNGCGTRQAMTTALLEQSHAHVASEVAANLDVARQHYQDAEEQHKDEKELSELKAEVKRLSELMENYGHLPYDGPRKTLPKIDEFKSHETMMIEGVMDRFRRNTIFAPVVMVVSACLCLSRFFDRARIMTSFVRVGSYVEAVLKDGECVDMRDSMQLPSQLRDRDPCLYQVEVRINNFQRTIIVSAALFDHLKAQFEGVRVSDPLLLEFARRARNINLQNINLEADKRELGTDIDVSHVLTATCLFYRLWEQTNLQSFQAGANCRRAGVLDEPTDSATVGESLLLMCPVDSSLILPCVFAIPVTLVFAGLFKLILALLFWGTPSQWLIVTILILLLLGFISDSGASLLRLIASSSDDSVASFASGFADMSNLCLSMWILDSKHGWRAHITMLLVAMSCDVFSQPTLCCVTVITGVRVLLRLKLILSGNMRALSIPELTPSNVTPALSSQRWRDTFSVVVAVLAITSLSIFLLLTVLNSSAAGSNQEEPFTIAAISVPLRVFSRLASSVQWSFNSIAGALVASLDRQLTSQDTYTTPYLDDNIAALSASAQRLMGVECPAICARHWVTGLPTSCFGCSRDTAWDVMSMASSRVMMGFLCCVVVMAVLAKVYLSTSTFSAISGSEPRLRHLERSVSPASASSTLEQTSRTSPTLLP